LHELTYLIIISRKEFAEIAGNWDYGTGPPSTENFTLVGLHKSIYSIKFMKNENTQCM